MDASEIRQRRMRAQRLRGTPARTPEEVVGLLGAMQAQELPIAKWSVAQRTKGVSESDMDRLLAEGRILRTHVLRPTWHFVLPADIRWLLALTGPRIRAGAAARYRQLELDPRTLGRAMRVLGDEVAGGRHRTRKELGEALSRRRIDPGGQRLPWFLMHSELEALLCSGAPRGSQQTYALVEERAPGARPLDTEGALAELARRYFTSRGPATVKDFTWWSSLTVAQAREGIELAREALVSREVDGRAYWFSASARRPRPGSPRIDLVQIYDELGIAYTESREVGVPRDSRIMTEANAFMHTVVLDGLLIGRWRRADPKDRVELEVLLERRPSRDERVALSREVSRYGRYLVTRVETSLRVTPS